MTRKGFLAWDPAQQLDGERNEPDPDDGEADLDDPDTDKDLDTSTLLGSLRDMVKGVGQSGCGFEAQLESVYRFLVDPAPYRIISVQEGKIVVEGPADRDGRVSCTLIEARNAGSACACDGGARQPVSDDHQALLDGSSSSSSPRMRVEGSGSGRCGDGHKTKSRRLAVPISISLTLRFIRRRLKIPSPTSQGR